MARSTTHRTPTETAAKPTAVERLRSDPNLTQPLDVPGRSVGNGTPTAASADGDGVQADPTHATVSAFEPAVAAVAAPPPSGERTGSGRPLTPVPVDPELGKAMVALAEIAEHGRWAKTYQAHVDRVRWLHALAGRASAELAERRHVPAKLWAELAAEVARWNGGGS